MTQPSRLLAGRVGKPSGLSGEVHVVAISDDPRRFEPGSELDHEDGTRLRVARSRRHGDRLLVAFEGVADRAAAERLRGALYVPAADLRRLDDGEFWDHEIVGCDVVRRDGVPVGIVSDVVHGVAQDRLSVATPAGEVLVPLVSEIVVSVDVRVRRIVIDPPPGLVDPG